MCSTASKACPTACSAPTSITPAAILPRASSSARLWKPCSPSEHAIAVLGDAALGDRLEKIAFNPLPGTQTQDMWGHQYDQQPNQVMCSLGRRDWTTNGPESNLFGLEPNFGCCTANLHQGWPKFAANLWMASPDGGLAAVAYGPSEVRTTISGVAVAIEETTEYPFRNRISLDRLSRAECPFPAAPADSGVDQGAGHHG